MTVEGTEVRSEDGLRRERRLFIGPLVSVRNKSGEYSEPHPDVFTSYDGVS